MGNLPSVVTQTTVTSPVTALPYLHRALFTFYPASAGFFTGFTTSTQSWMYRSPTTNLGIVAQLGPNDWASRLKSLGCTVTDPAYIAAGAYFGALLGADVNGLRDTITRPDKLYLGLRGQSVVSSQTVTFSTNTAGTVRIRVNRAKYNFATTTPAGALADVTITADGVLTTTQLATAAAAALNADVDFAAAATASSALGVVTIVTDRAGQPLIIEITASTPGPTMAQAITTANIAGDYGEDLDAIVLSAEYGSHLDPPARLFYWVTDLQADDVVNLEGLLWAKNQSDTALHNPPRDYMFVPWSPIGSAVITRTALAIGNFNAAATDSLSQAAMAALSGVGYKRAMVVVHDRYEMVVPAILGRTIGYLPGEVSFTAKVLYGGTAASRMTPREWGDLEYLSADRRFSFYSAEGALGGFRHGATPDGSFGDRTWLEDYATYASREALIAWMQLKNIVTYTNVDILGGKSVIAARLAQIPAINAETLEVTFLTREQVNPDDIANRVYKYYGSFADTNGVINQIGTLADPITITLKDAG